MTYYICSWLVGLVVLALILNRKFVGLIPAKKMCNASSTDFFLSYGYVSYSRTILNYPTRTVLPALPTLVLNLYNFLFLSPINGWFFAPSLSWNLGRVKEQFRSDFSATTILEKSQIIIFFWGSIVSDWIRWLFDFSTRFNGNDEMSKSSIV